MIKFLTNLADGLSMSSKWFVQKEGQVEGPFFTEDVQGRIDMGHFRMHDLVWAHGLAEWRSLQSWKQDLPQLLLGLQNKVSASVWHYASDNKSYGPFNQEVLIRELRNLGSIAGVMLWTSGMKEWSPIFEFHDLLAQVGVNKRQFPRADVNGKAVLEISGVSVITNLLSVSEGGFGLILERGLDVGQIIKVELKSPAFPGQAIAATAEVRYINGNYAGFKFETISSEAKGQIVQYIRKAQAQFLIAA